MLCIRINVYGNGLRFCKISMKKYLVFSLSLLSLVACGGNKVSNESNNSLSGGEIVESSTTSKIDSKWGKQYNEMIIDTLGADIPYIENTGYDIVSSVDDFGEPMVIFYVYFNEEISLKLEEYSAILKTEGYSVSLNTQNNYDPSYGLIQYDLYVADKVVTDKKGIELQFLEGSYKNKECMGIFAFNYVHDEKNVWPTNLVTSLLGHDVPHLEDNGSYEYSARINVDGNNKYIDMVIYNVDSNVENEYAKLLEEYGFTVTDATYDQETGEYMGRFAYSPDRKYVIQFGLSQYGLEIYIFEI